MLISISGSQGCGKSTILNQLAKFGYKVVERKTARSVLAEFPGMTLEDIYADVNTAMKWQDIILERKIKDEQPYIQNDELCFTERSYADLFTYAAMAISKNNHCSNWIDAYYNKCKEHNQHYLHTFYIHGGKFKPVSDGVRGTNQHYSTMVNVSMYTFLNQMVEMEHKLTDIHELEVNQRISHILTASINYFLQTRG